MLDLILEPFAISLQLASGPVRGKSLGQHFGDVVCVLHQIIILRPSNFPVGSRLFHMDQKSISSPQVMRVR